MISQIIAAMRNKGVSDKDLRTWLNEQAEKADARGDWESADMYRMMALESVFQQRFEQPKDKP